MPSQVVYSADLTAGSLKLRESRIVAALLLSGVSDDQFKDAVVRENVLQARTPATGIRLARLVRTRLEGFDSDLWSMVRDGEKTLATQALLAATLKHSALLRDFMDLVLRDEYRLLHVHLPTGVWTAFLEECKARDLAVVNWSESTLKRLRSTVFQILAQAGFLGNTSKRELQKVAILDELQRYLTKHDEHKVLRCLQLP